MINKKTINLICVFLVLAVIMSSLLITSMTVLGLNNTEDPNSSDNKPQVGQKPSWNGDIGDNFNISLEDLSGLLNLDGLIGLLSLSPQSADLNVYRVKSTETEKLYLRIKSFGDYNGTNSWLEAPEYTKLIDSKYSSLYLPSSRVDKSEVIPSSVRIEPHINQFLVPYYPSAQGNQYFQTSDIISFGSTDEPYTMFFHTDDTLNSYFGPNYYDKYEEEYRKFVHSTYLNIDDETLSYMKKIIDKNNFSSADPDIVNKVAKYIQRAAKYDMLYNRKLDNEKNVAIAFLETYKSGICQHYATSATLLFRALGIPARYTVGFTANTKANEWVNITAQQAHAWVEVYIPSVGWKYVEVTGSTDNSEPFIPSVKPYIPGISDRVFNVSPINVEKKYDGSPLSAPNKITGFEEIEAMGYTYSAVVSGERTEPGVSSSKIEKISLFDKNGQDVTEALTSLNLKEGTIHVYKCVLTVTSGSASKVYDGTPLTNAFDFIVEGDENIMGEFRTTASQTNVGKCINSFTFKIKNTFDNDITNHYKIKKIYGTLEVTPLEITLKAGDATKVYDGTELTCSDYMLTSGNLAKGDRIVGCVTMGSQTEIGRSENTIDPTFIKILNEQNEDVTENYSIKLIPGKLIVTP